MLQMGQKHYEITFKERIAKLHLEEGRTIASLVKEYGVSKASISIWIKKYREECNETPDNISPNVYEELKALRKKAAELEKENAFLKKAAAFFAKEIDD